MKPKPLLCENYHPKTFVPEMQNDLDLTAQEAGYVDDLKLSHWAAVGLSIFAPLDGVKYVPDSLAPAAFSGQGMQDFFVGQSTQGFKGVLDFRDGTLGQKITELQQASDADSLQRLERVEKRIADLTKAVVLSMAQKGHPMMVNMEPALRLIEVEPAKSLVVTDPTMGSHTEIKGDLKKIAIVNSGIADVMLASERIAQPNTVVTSIHQGKGALFGSMLSRFLVDVSEQGLTMNVERGLIVPELPPHARTKPLMYPTVEHAVGDSATQLAAQGAKQGKFDVVILPQVLGTDYEQCDKIVRAAGQNLEPGGYFILKMPMGYDVKGKHYGQLRNLGREVIGELVESTHAGLIAQNAHRTMPLQMLAELVIFKR